MRHRVPDPRCAGPCQRFAADMPELDTSWAESRAEVEAADEDERQRRRAEYVRHGDGTYNEATGSFWCDGCYIKVGMPLGTAP